MKRFVKISTLFCLGLLVLVLALDFALGRLTERNQGEHLIGREVYVARKIARTPDPAVKELYLGDSVARQIFPPGEEPEASLKYITTNQAISVAGQYYLLGEALAVHPNVKRVYLFYTPSAWGNDLDQVYTRDYFLGYFHDLRHVKDTFLMKRDVGLLAAHLARAAFPNLMAANSSMHISPAKPRQAWAKKTGKGEEIQVSEVSRKFLARIRETCAANGIELRVYPCPISDEFSFAETPGLYDAPITYLPAESFQEDTIHIRRQHVVPVRTELTSRLALPLPMARRAERTQPGSTPAKPALATAGADRIE